MGVSTHSAHPPELSTKGTGKNTLLPVFPWKGFECILYNLLPKVQLLISMCLGAQILHRSPGSLCCLLPLGHSNNIIRSLTSLWKELVHICCPSFCSCHQRNRPPDCLFLIAKGAYTQESQGTVANKEAILDGHVSTHHRAQYKRTGKTNRAPLPVFHGKRFDGIFHKLWLKGPASN